jgi:putative RecB family exonuclease
MTDQPVQMPSRLSPSSVTTFLQCPLKYKLSRIDKVPEPPSEAQVLGNMTHDALEHLLKMPAGQRTLTAARQVMVRQWHDKWQQVCENDLSLSAHGQHVLRWNAWSCVENYFGLEDPNGVEPAGLEAEVFAEVAGAPMLGYMDRWLLNEDGTATIQDYKTGKVSRPPYDQEKKLQLYIYTDLVEQLMGVKVSRAELIYLKGKGKRVAYTPTADDLDGMRQTVRKVWDDLRQACETGEFATNKTRLCDWCHYKQSCPAWQRK